jgi:Sigma-70, region 4
VVIDVAREEPLDEKTWQKLRSVLDEEICRLPEKYRAPIILCHLESKSQDRAARELGWPKSSLANRLGRGRELLREQLVRRGLTLSVGALGTALCEKAGGAPVPALLMINTVKAAMSIAAGKAVAAGLVSARALLLAEEAMRGMVGV